VDNVARFQARGVPKLGRLQIGGIKKATGVNANGYHIVDIDGRSRVILASKHKSGRGAGWRGRYQKHVAALEAELASKGRLATAQRRQLSRMRKALRFERASVSGSVGESTVHEMGHALQEHLSRTVAGFDKRWKDAALHVKVNEPYAVSEYAWSDASLLGDFRELFAESVTLYEKSPDELPAAIRTILDEVL
jgi:hypothetical protein